MGEGEEMNLKIVWEDGKIVGVFNIEDIKDILEEYKRNGYEIKETATSIKISHKKKGD